MKKRGLIIFSALVCAFLAFTVHAQLQNGDVVLTLNPEYPSSNSNVTASVSTYTTDLNKAKISWIPDGNLSLEGVGKKSFSFTTGSAGTSVTLEVKIETITNNLIDKQLVITPTDVDILWEAYDAYVPPFYKGKKLGAQEGTFKVVALPNGTTPAGFSYDWKLDDTSKQDSSGYEKNYYIFKKSFLDKNNTVGVEISDLLGKSIGAGDVTVGTSTPKILFYEKDPMLGTRWERSLSDGFTIAENGTTIVAEPYFFSRTKGVSNLTFDWYINDNQADNQQNFLSIKPTTGESGSSKIKVVINNVKTLFQSMEKELNVNF